MKNLIFSGNGFPGTIKTLETFQNNIYEVVKVLLARHDNYTVLWGMDIYTDGTESFINEGAFVLNGGIVPFANSAYGEQITVEQTIENGDFNTNPSNENSVESLPAYSTKIARVGTGGIHTFPTTNLKRYNKLMDISYSNIYQLSKSKSNGLMVPGERINSGHPVHFLSNVRLACLDAMSGQYVIPNNNNFLNRMCVYIVGDDVGVCEGVLEITGAVVDTPDQASLDARIDTGKTIAFLRYDRANNMVVGTSVESVTYIYDLKQTTPEIEVIKIGTMLRIDERYYIDVNPKII